MYSDGNSAGGVDGLLDIGSRLVLTNTTASITVLLVNT